jgi:hypothetical protein
VFVVVEFVWVEGDEFVECGGECPSDRAKIVSNKCTYASSVEEIFFV